MVLEGGQLCEDAAVQVGSLDSMGSQRKGGAVTKPGAKQQDYSGPQILHLAGYFT